MAAVDFPEEVLLATFKNLTTDELSQIEAAIGEAEKNTSGEIIPMIVRSSSAVGHMPLRNTIIMALTSTLIFLLFKFDEQICFLILLGLWVFFYGISFLLARNLWVQRLLIPKFDQDIQVWRRARAEFIELHLARQSEKAAVLLFVSVMERKAIVLPGESVLEKTKPEDWQEVITDLLSGLRENQWKKAFVDGIECSGKILKRVCPSSHPPGEFENRLIIKD